MRRREQREGTAGRIFAAAARLFAEQGFEATTVEEITAAAGVAKGTFFVHFPSKHALLAHLGAAQMGRATAAVEAAPGFAGLPFRGQLRAVVAGLAAGLEGQRELVRVVAVELMRSQAALAGERRNIDALDALLGRLAERAQARGELRGDTPPAQIAALLRSVYLAAVMEWLGQEGEAFEAVAWRLLALALEGVEP